MCLPINNIKVKFENKPQEEEEEEETAVADGNLENEKMAGACVAR